MRLARLWLTDFRSYASADIAFAPGLTALLGQNGEGKTNVMEAIGYLATLSSFLEALKRVGLLSKENTKIRLDIKNDSVELIAESFDVGKADEVIDARHVGEELEISFNPEYLRAGIEAAPSDEITIEIARPTSPVLIRGNETDDFLYLLMPIRN